MRVPPGEIKKVDKPPEPGDFVRATWTVTYVEEGVFEGVREEHDGDKRYMIATGHKRLKDSSGPQEIALVGLRVPRVETTTVEVLKANPDDLEISSLDSDEA